MAFVFSNNTPSRVGVRSHVRQWMAGTVLVIAITVCYSNSLRAPFLFDDAGAVENNATIRRLWSFDVLSPPRDGSTTTGRPIVNLTFAINYAVSGENVGSYHALNIAFHALAALTLMGLVRRTLTTPVLRARFVPGAHSLGFLIALLWALHPLQTETVVCIAQRTESLMGLFYLFTLYAFIRGVECHVLRDISSQWRSRFWFGLSAGACLAGMGTKEVMVTAPLIVLLYDRTFVAGSFAAAWRERRSYYRALFGTWLLLAWLVLRGGGARGVAAGFGLGVSWWSYLLQQCEAIVLYLKLSLWPHPLVLDYGTGLVNSLAEVWWQAGAVVALLVAAIGSMIRKPAAGFLCAWFFVILGPSSSVVPLVTQTMAEHRIYLPLAGVVGLIVAMAYLRIGVRAAWLGMAVAAVLGVVTHARNDDYRDALVIWGVNVRDYPLSARAHNNLAWTLQQRGRTEQANVHFARAVALDPGYVTAYYNWGVALLDQKRAVDAIVQLETAVRIEPRHADAHLNLGNALVQAQRANIAIPHYERALEIRPAADAHYNLGVALAEVGRHDDAAKHFRRALEMTPALPEAHYQLARIAEQSGQLAQAEIHYGDTLRLAPDHAAAHAKLGLLLARSQRLAPAAEHFRAVIQLSPDNADARANLGNVLLLQGHIREAVAHYELALRLRPDDPRTRESLRLARESQR